MIREQRKTDQWQKVSQIELGPGQYNPYASKDGGKYSLATTEKPYKLDSAFPRKKADVPFGSGQDRFKKFLPLNILPGPGQYESKSIQPLGEEQQNSAATSFKSHSPRLQMYYDLERNISKSTLTYDKQERLAKQLVELIDRKMRERAPTVISKSALNRTFESPKSTNTKVLTGLAITNSLKPDRVPSIPFEAKKDEPIGPGTYNPNPDIIHKKLPHLAMIQKHTSQRPVPKKALESFINTIFTNDQLGVDSKSALSRERSNTRSKNHIRLGKAMFGGPRTEQVSPRGRSISEDDDIVDPFHKPNSIFLSKTKRTNLADEKSLGPGVYNPHDASSFGAKRESAFKKKTDFGDQEGRKFTLNRNIENPFTDSTHLENPPSWKYQNPEKDSMFYQKSDKKQRSNEKSMAPLNLQSVTKAVHKHNETPGPGSYDVNFKDELKVLDQKLSIRYQLGPFGTTSPRFKEKPSTQPDPTNDQKSQQIFNIIKKQEMRKYMDEALKLIKDMQKNQESHIFKSSTERFKEQIKESIQPNTFFIGVGGAEQQVKAGEQDDQSKNQTSSHMRGGSYNPKVLKPFDSTSPRFEYDKGGEDKHKAPGPGHYTKHYEEIEEQKLKELKRAGSINKKYLPMMGIEDKEKFSLFGKIVKQGHESQLGPGYYDTHAINGVASKKNFNTSLQKQSPRLINNQSGQGYSSLSTNVKLSPRSSQATVEMK